MFVDALVRTFSNASYRDRDGWFYELLAGPESSSGEVVNERSAMALSAYFASIRNISEDIAKLPFKVYRKTGGRRQVFDSHPAYRLLTSRPNEDMTAFSFRETLTAHALAYHGGFAEIQRTAGGSPVGLHILDPTSTSVMRSDRGDLFYRVRLMSGSHVDLPADNVLHIHGLGFDGLTGYAIARVASDSLGSAIAQQKYRGSFFKRGTNVGGIVSVPGSLGKQSIDQYREQFEQRYGGSGNSHRPMILTQGATWTQTTTDPQSSQMMETAEFNIEDVCRWFRMPPSKIGHFARAQGWSTLEEMNRDYVTSTLMSWIVRWEQEVGRKLIGIGEQGVYAKHELQAMLRAAYRERQEGLAIQRRNGIISADEWRALEEMDPMGEGGDFYLVEANMQRLDQVGMAPVEEDMTEDAVSVLVAAFEDIIAYERERAARSKDLPTWTTSFYAARADELSIRMAPVVSDVVDTLNTDGGCYNAEDMASAIASQYVSNARRLLSDGEFADPHDAAVEAVAMIKVSMRAARRRKEHDNGKDDAEAPPVQGG